MPMVKNKFGKDTDGPCTTFTPKTLVEILRTKGVEEELIAEIFATINAQKMVSYNEGWSCAKEFYINSDSSF